MTYVSPVLQEFLNTVTTKEKTTKTQATISDAEWERIEKEEAEADRNKSYWYYGHDMRINEQIARGAGSRAHILKFA